MNIVVLGAGLAGLTCAYRIKQLHPEANITILEQSDHIGGWLHSVRRDGFVLEQGPRGFRPKGKGAALIQLGIDLGLEKDMLLADPKAKRRYIYRERLYQVPTGPKSLITSELRNLFLEALQTDWKLKSFPIEDETLGQFSRRHFGESFTQWIMQPAVSGIWAGDIDHLSAVATLPQLKILEQKEGSLLRSWIKKKRAKKEAWPFAKQLQKAPLVSFRRGMQQLPEALAQQLAGHIELKQTIKSVHRQESGQYFIQTNQRSYEATHLISALPAHALSSIVFDLDKALSHKLSQITYGPICVVTLAYTEKVHTIKGFGYLKVQSSNPDILGVVMNDQSFPEHAPDQGQSLSVMIGGATFTNFDHYSETDFIELAEQAVREHLNISRPADLSFCKVMPRAIPQYTMGYTQLLQTLKRHQPDHFWMVGNYLDGVSMIDTVIHAEKIAKTVGLKPTNML